MRKLAPLALLVVSGAAHADVITFSSYDANLLSSASVSLDGASQTAYTVPLGTKLNGGSELLSYCVDLTKPAPAGGS